MSNDPITKPAADARRSLPSVDVLAGHDALRESRARTGARAVTRAARAVIDSAREALPAGPLGEMASVDALAQRTAALLYQQELQSLRPVINATGIILHTGLGRAPLAAEAIEAIRVTAGGYTNLELELDSGERGGRTTAVADLLCELTGAEAATVVNNNAAATLLVLVAVADGRNVVVSRGELIEIGGSFRLPSIMEASGAVLRETGTTNRTRLSDYEQAINADTAALMKVHTSNYRVVGFTESVTTAQLVQLGRQRGLAVIDDIGSGALVDLGEAGLPDEPTARAAIDADADLVIFSGDKVLGGPQAGIILGKRQWIRQIERNPLMRALRVGKLTLAGLEATLKLYRKPATAWQRIPALAMARCPVDALRRRGESLVRKLREIERLELVEMADGEAYLGGGAAPMAALPSIVIGVRARGIGERELARRLRTGARPVVARTIGGQVQLDLRTIMAEQVDDLILAVSNAAR